MGTSVSKRVPVTWRKFRTALDRPSPRPEEVLDGLLDDLPEHGRPVFTHDIAEQVLRTLMLQIEVLSDSEGSAPPAPVVTDFLRNIEGGTMAELLGNLTADLRRRLEPGHNGALPVEWALASLAQVLYQNSCPTLKEYFQGDIGAVRSRLRQALEREGPDGIAWQFVRRYCQDAVSFYVARERNHTTAAGYGVVERKLQEGLERVVGQRLGSKPRVERPGGMTDPAWIRGLVREGLRLLRGDKK